LPDNLTEDQLRALGFSGSKDEIIGQIQGAQKAQIDKLKAMADDYGATVGKIVDTFINPAEGVENKGLKNIS
jgi:hypothetical protein